ncbi:hypothetical protein P378_19850 [Desulforamulus profundi]|uniref:Transposase IS4-like domain-containing protein n=1 Tax=Desulforamulus profundi TaxID=1383067 RepID=A0A2C6MA49_9FIRM|nr:hypothetical protein [Desulforamulus profundi]PHJ36858.1 hypothetical protein P378_19850 [Desulforamulus profundi]
MAQRGRNKQKRTDLRQFGLAQVVTKEFLIPVFSEIYEGNKSDKELFIPTLTKLRKKLSELNLDMEEITIVFDKGSNSKDNFEEDIIAAYQELQGLYNALVNSPWFIYAANL